MEESFRSQVNCFLILIVLDILPNGENMRLLPVGIQHSNKTKSIIGNGVVIDAEVLLEDLQAITNNGLNFHGRLFISNR